MNHPSTTGLGSDVRSRVSTDEWTARVDLACCHRLLAHYGSNDLTYNHLSMRVPGEPQHLLIKPPTMMFEEVTASSLLKFDFEGQGNIYIDGKSTPNTVTTDNKPADCTITVSLDNFKKMVARELDGTTAFMQGKLKVAGDMSVAMKLGPVLAKAAG
jgi:hypothetical protein